MRKNNRAVVAGAICVVAIALVLAACTSDTDDAGEVSTPASPAETTPGAASPANAGDDALADCSDDEMISAAGDAFPDEEVREVTGYDCQDEYAVAFVAVGSDTDERDATLPLKSVDGKWERFDDCGQFPTSLQDDCNTN